MIRGNLRILYIKISGVFVPVGCLTSNDFTEDFETLSTTTRDNGGWRTFLPTNQGYTISFSGLQINSELDTTKISYDRLKDLKRARTLIEWKLEDITNSLVDLGEGYITDLGETAPVDDFLAFAGTIRGYGQTYRFVDNTPPTAPYLDPLVSVSYTGVVMTWSGATDDTGVVSYNIYRNGVLYDTSTTETYTDVGVVSGQIYSYNISALDGLLNESPLSNKRVTPVIPALPSGNYILAEDGQNILTEANEPLITES